MLFQVVLRLLAILHQRVLLKWIKTVGYTKSCVIRISHRRNGAITIDFFQHFKRLLQEINVIKWSSLIWRDSASFHFKKEFCYLPTSKKFLQLNSYELISVVCKITTQKFCKKTSHKNCLQVSVTDILSSKKHYKKYFLAEYVSNFPHSRWSGHFGVLSWMMARQSPRTGRHRRRS